MRRPLFFGRKRRHGGKRGAVEFEDGENGKHDDDCRNQKHIRRVIVDGIAVHVKRPGRLAELLNDCRQRRPDHHGNQHPKYHADALKHSRLVGRRKIADGSGQIGGQTEIGAHQHKSRDADRRHRGLPFETKGACKQHADRAEEVYAEERQSQLASILHFGHQDSEHDGGNRGSHDNDRNGDNITAVGVLQGTLGIHDQKGHKAVVGDADDPHRDISVVKIFVGFDHAFAEAVPNIAVVGRGIWLKIFAVLDQKESEDADQADDGAEQDVKERPVAGGDFGTALDPPDDGFAGGRKISVLCHPVQSAENGSHGKDGHDGDDAFDLAANGPRGIVGDPSIEGGVVGGGADIGHDAIHDDDDDDGDDGSGLNTLDAEGLDIVNGNERKRHNDNAPDEIAEADEASAVALSVGPDAADEGGGGGGDGARGDHDGNGNGTEPVVGKGHGAVDENVEIHIFDDPSDLPEQPENENGRPKFGTQARGRDRSRTAHNDLPNDKIIVEGARKVNSGREKKVEGTGEEKLKDAKLKATGINRGEGANPVWKTIPMREKSTQLRAFCYETDYRCKSFLSARMAEIGKIFLTPILILLFSGMGQ